MHHPLTTLHTHQPMHQSILIPQSPSSLITGAAYGGGTSGSYTADISSDGYVTNEIPEQVYDEVLQYPLTPLSRCETAMEALAY